MTELERVIAQSQRLSERTRTIYLAAVRQFLEFAGPDPRRWNGSMVEAWRDSLRRGRKSQTVNVYLAGLRFATRRISQLARNPGLDFARVAETLKAEPEEERRPLSAAQARALILACNGTRPQDLRDRAIVVVGLRTGLRLGGLASIRIENCSDGELRKVRMKGGRFLDLHPGSQAWGALRAWTAWLARRDIKDGPAFRHLIKARLDGTVAVADGLSHSGIYRAVKARAARAGLPGVFPHIFRHTFVSLCEAQGVPDAVIQSITGHLSTSSMAKYRKIETKRQAEASDSLPLDLGD
jgi:integrase